MSFRHSESPLYMNAMATLRMLMAVVDDVEEHDEHLAGELRRASESSVLAIARGLEVKSRQDLSEAIGLTARCLAGLDIVEATNIYDTLPNVFHGAVCGLTQIRKQLDDLYEAWALGDSDERFDK